MLCSARARVSEPPCLCALDACLVQPFPGELASSAESAAPVFFSGPETLIIQRKKKKRLSQQYCESIAVQVQVMGLSESKAEHNPEWQFSNTGVAISASPCLELGPPQDMSPLLTLSLLFFVLFLGAVLCLSLFLAFFHYSSAALFKARICWTLHLNAMAIRAWSPQKCLNSFKQ